MRMGPIIITVTPFWQPRRIKAYFGANAGIPWLFLGRDFKRLKSVESSLGGNFKRVDISRLKDEAADKLRSAYNLWIDQLNRLNDNSLEWWFGAISSRDTDETSLFQSLCYLEALKQLKAQGVIPQLLVVENAGLGEVIKEWLKKNDLPSRVHNHRLNYFRMRGYFIYRWLKMVLLILRQSLAASITRNNSVAKNFAGTQPFILINTHVFDYNFTPDGRFRDSCFPYLIDFISKSGFKAVIYPVIYGLGINFLELYKKMRGCAVDFLIPQDYLSFGDYLAAFTYPFRFIIRSIKVIPFEGLDAGPLIREAQKSNFTDSALRAILIYRSFKRIKKLTPPPQEAIVWYENQVIHKAFIAGARFAFAKTRIVGAQPFIHALNFLSLVPIKSEAEKNLTPDLLLTTSEYQGKIACSFVQGLRCQPAAALRYSHLFDENRLRREKPGDKPVILVLLPLYIAEAIEMLENIFLIKQKQKDARVIIKCHPACSIDKIIAFFGKRNWPADFLAYEGSVADALDEAAIVIGANSSSMVEAASRGLPVIFISRQAALSSNLLSGVESENVSVCYSAPDLERALEKYLNLGALKRDEFRQLGRKIRDLYFRPVTEENLLPFLSLTE